MAGISVRHLENAGKVKSMRSDGGVASPTSVLVLQEEVMMGSWDSETPSPSQDGSQKKKSMEAAAVEERKLCSRDVESSATSQSTSRSSLVETLQTCLTSLPSSTKSVSTASMVVRQPWTKSSSSVMAASRTSNRASPGLAAPTAACKAESVDVIAISSRVTNSSHSVGATTSKVAKRRCRASRRVPTTVLNAEPSNFLDLVQKLTGIRNKKKPELGGVQPVQLLRPQPRRPPTSANKHQPDFQGPNKTSQSEAPSVSQIGSRLQNLTRHQIHPSCNSMQQQASNYPFNGSSETSHVSGFYKETPTSCTPSPPSPPPPPHASISPLTGLMYQPEEVMAFLKTVNSSSTTPASFSCHSWEHKFLGKAIKPNRMEAVTFSSSTIQYECLDDDNSNNIDNTNIIKHSCYNNIFEDCSTVMTSDYPQKSNFFDQEEIDSWLMMPCWDRNPTTTLEFNSEPDSVFGSAK